MTALIWHELDRKIIDTIPDNKPPQVTFTCSANGPASNFTHPSSRGMGTDPKALGGMSSLADGQEMGTCMFQFWVDRIESFYCNLDECSWQSKDSFGKSDCV